MLHSSIQVPHGCSTRSIALVASPIASSTSTCHTKPYIRDTSHICIRNLPKHLVRSNPYTDAACSCKCILLKHYMQTNMHPSGMFLSPGSPIINLKIQTYIYWYQITIKLLYKTLTLSKLTLKSLTKILIHLYNLHIISRAVYTCTFSPKSYLPNFILPLPCA